jgi:hypothetical protein
LVLEQRQNLKKRHRPGRTDIIQLSECVHQYVCASCMFLIPECIHSKFVRCKFIISVQCIKEHTAKFEELHNLYCLIIVNRIMKTRRMGWVGHVS